MELTFPFLLIIVGWNPDNVDASMVLQSSLHPSEAACEAVGKAFVAEREPLRSAATPAAYKYFCIAAPGPDEYNAAFGNGE
ncbi:MAG: hypothetical protein EDM03_01585 [Porphyrobacter sp. IPPAS B-1204]|nr:MAG: hypothetical protein EDM03_01585 [Porphyrobacter sp. IPPAS B-1204]